MLLLKKPLDQLQKQDIFQWPYNHVSHMAELYT